MRTKVQVCLSVLLAAGLAASALAQPPQPPAEPAQPAAPAAKPAEPKVAPEAQRVIDAVKAYYATLPGVSVTATITQSRKNEPPGSPSATMKIAAARPNRYTATAGDPAEFQVVSDGERFFEFIGADFNKYCEKPAPAGFGQMVDLASFDAPPSTEEIIASPHMMTLALLDGQRFADVMAGAKQVTYIGKEDLQGQPHDHLRVADERVDLDLWFAAGDRPWLAQAIPDPSRMFEELGEIGEQLMATSPRVTFAYTGWEAKSDFPEGTFKFVPPAGAEKVDSLMEAIQKQMESGAGHQPASPEAPLVGKPAPELNLDLLDGGTATLAQHKGKNVVVLDFWATWCPPCVKGLPIVTKVTQQFKDKGVVFYAVNERESADIIRKFLEKNKLSIPVVLDKDGAAGDHYGVTGIPQTVLIGKDGTVQAVHVGFTEDLEQQLTTQLQTLVEGKPLATPATPK